MLFTGLREKDVEAISKILTGHSIPHKTGIDPNFMDDPGSTKGRSSAKINHEHFLLDVELHDLEKLNPDEQKIMNDYGLHYQLEEPDFNLHPEEEKKIQSKIDQKPHKFFQYLMAFIAFIWILMIVKGVTD